MKNFRNVLFFFKKIRKQLHNKINKHLYTQTNYTQYTLNEIFNTYFIGLDKYLDGKLSAEELLEKYKTTFETKDIKVVIRYIDSWGHLWKGKVAWPRESKFIEYLNKRLNEN